MLWPLGHAPLINIKIPGPCLKSDISKVSNGDFLHNSIYYFAIIISIAEPERELQTNINYKPRELYDILI